jgi:4-diphosphocytidyl-2-C-methyl-D-erythritol kinase
MRLQVIAPAKLNLGLFLGPTREDGRHELVTLFQSLSLHDTLEVATGEGIESDVVTCSPEIEGENLAARALAALRARAWDGPALEIRITKEIPIAAGMAGGSADAAATLRAAMSIAPGRAEEIDAIAASLGADVPSQLLPGVALGTGAGEIVEHFGPLAEHAYVVVPSNFQLSTPEVFKEADRLGLPRSREDLRSRYDAMVRVLAPGARLPAELLVNDLERAAVSLCPSIAETLKALRDAGAEQAIVSGSGPTVVGIWWGTDAFPRAGLTADLLADRFPNAVLARPVTAEVALPSLI